MPSNGNFLKLFSFFIFSLIAFSSVAFARTNSCEIFEGDFCTETQGGWGSFCHGGNVGCLRNDNWDTVIGGSLVVGKGFNIVLSDSQAVRSFLPEIGTPNILDENHFDPFHTEAGVFGGQVTALKLNVLFSDEGIGLQGPDSNISIGELAIKSGKFEGLSVRQFLDLSEKVLGGNTSLLSDYNATVSNINDAATSINENFDDCETDNGFLENPFCVLPFCGDGKINQKTEQCDDGNNLNGDGCSSACTVERSCDYGCFSPDSLDDNVTEHIGHSNEITLQDFLDSKGYDFNVVRDQTNTQVWHNPNNVELQIKFLGKFAAQQHVFGYYLDGDANSFVPLFEDANHPSYSLPVALPGNTFAISIPAGSSIGFGIDAWKNGQNFYFTQNSLNSDKKDHVLVFDSCGEFVLAFEDKFSDFDFQDIVVSVKKISCSPAPACGDGIINQLPEHCDGQSGVPENYVCTNECKLQYVPFCGDGKVNQQSEACDGQNGVPEHYTCTAQCTLQYIPFCGDNVVNQASEDCDGTDGVPEHYLCTAECKLDYVPYCGDGQVNQQSETCDDGNSQNGDGCSFSCQIEPQPFCGNGVKDGAEECDGTDGVPEHYACSQECTLQYIPFCGDAIKNDATEECDGTDGVPDHYTCTAQCTLEYVPFCGDGTVNQTSEECDGTAGVPGHYFCTKSCALEYIPYCGDAIVNQEGETCDDGNYVNGDGCDAFCRAEYCGDRVKNNVSEECDGPDGVTPNHVCTAQCTLQYVPYCGDGIKNQDTESCDGTDGVPDHYACTQECALQYLPYCGDGAINQETEQCDDGNNVDGDTCSALCTLECRPPVTTKTYGEPFFSDENSEWINSLTDINFSAQSQTPLCATGEPQTFYRVTLVDDSYCRNKEACQSIEGSGKWMPFDGPVQINEQSCHLVEFYSTDSNGIAEEKLQQCAFVDNSGPTPVNTVGEPSDKWTPGKNGQPESIFYPQIKDLCWNGQENGIDCWKVTLLTPITMSCTDPQPHPVGRETISFQAQLDGDDATAKYCGLYEGNFDANTGWCTIAKNELQFYFAEETEHNLKYFCTDALGNKGPEDDEKFKVEGTKFEIQLNKKWNLISVPFALINNSPDEVFKGVKNNLDSVWYFDAFTDSWSIYRPNHPEASSLDSIEPGNGYWVSMLDENVLTIGGSLFNPAITPPSKPLKKGWNLIGYFGADGQNGYNGPAGNGKLASCELISLNSLFEGKGWTTLATYWEPDNPNPWHYLSESNRMDPGAGYWLNATKDNEFSYSTVCG